MEVESEQTSVSEAKPSEAVGSTGPSSAAHPRIDTPACLVIGMAGSGKTTLVDALSAHIENAEELAESLAELELSDDTTKAAQQRPKLSGEGAFVVNLDPAVHDVPYEPNVDIRDTIDYKAVMKDYNLGPNGAILTALNLYATRFDQVLTIVEKRAPDARAVIIDTPGQIETFTWSASGTIITDALAMTLPTVIIFVIDTHRSQSAMTFVSNMLYACSIMYKTRLPMVVAFNKVDVSSCQFAQAWMRDFDEFDRALKDENFIGNLARSMAMALEEFYKAMRTVGVSAHTGEGIPQLVEAIHDAAREYETDYRPMLDERRRKRAEDEANRKDENLGRFKKDMTETNDEDPGFRALNHTPNTYHDDDDDDDDDDDAGEGEAHLSGFTSSRRARHDARLAKMKGEIEYDEEEERQAYEKMKKQVDAMADRR